MDFVQALVNDLGVSAVVAGPNYRFGAPPNILHTLPQMCSTILMLSLREFLGIQ